MWSYLFTKLKKIIPKPWAWILDHEGFRRYFTNTSWMFLGQIFSLLVSFFVGAWIARYLGPSNYGVLSYVLAFVGLFSFVASLGLDGILNRDLVAYPEKRDELLGTAFRLRLLSGGLTFFLILIISGLLNLPALTRLLIILYALIFIIQTPNIIANFFQAEVKAKKIAQVQVAAVIASSILKIILILLGGNLVWLIIIFIFDNVWLVLGFLISYRASNLRIKAWSFNKNLAKEMLASSWLLMLSAAASYIYLKIDQVMIGAYLGVREVGLYAAGVKFVEVWYFIPAMICASLFPAIINARKANNLAMYRSRLRNLYWLLAIIAVLIALPLTFLAAWAINLLFGAAYLGAVEILQIYVWSGVGLFIGWGINQYFLSANRLRAIFCFNLFSMLLNIGLNLIFIPRFGLNGAAWATLISYSVGPLVVWAIGTKKKMRS